MAAVFKTFLNSDITTTRTLLHEAIPITGALVSGAYGAKTTVTGSEPHIKTYSHGMFQSVYDYPYLSSSANHIFDVTMGISTGSSLSQSAYSSHITQQSKKVNIYNQMASLLMGHDVSGSIRRFDRDGDLGGDHTQQESLSKINDALFFNFSRLLVKDEIKKGSFKMEFGMSQSLNHVASTSTPKWMEQRVLVSDDDGSNKYHINSPAGEYGILYLSDSAVTGSETLVYKANPNITADGTANGKVPCGLVFYQAGVAVVTSSMFMANLNGAAHDVGAGPTPDPQKYNLLSGSTHRHATCVYAMNPTMMHYHGAQGDLSSDAWKAKLDNGEHSMTDMMNNGTIDQVASAVRNRLYNVSFNNTTELNSTVYFCRANHNEFNYSSNPSFLDGSRIRVKNSRTDMPRTYITTVGLYSADNELLAIAKLSEPLRKDPTNELTLRVRLDY